MPSFTVALTTALLLVPLTHGATTFSEHLIYNQFSYPYGIAAGDLDGDGDMDVAATSWHTPGRVVWFENSGDPKGTWTMHTLKTDWRSANQVIIANFNGDKKPDLTAIAEHGSYELRWWRNEGSP